MIEAAFSLNDLRTPPGNHLEPLYGDREGQYSIRINNQYRVCFAWCNSCAYDVEIVDYHQEGCDMRTENLVHPGEILREEFMKPMGISQNALAMAIHVPTTRIGEIVHERRGVTADTALRLAKYFETTSEFWMNLQTNYDLGITLKEKKDEISMIKAVG